MLQAFLVLPALALAYLFFAKTPWGKRIVHLLVAFGAMLLAGGWWVAIVALWPAASRPYIGGSQDNSILELTLGYNGFGRLTGDEVGSVGGGGGGTGTGMWGATGLFRLFNSEIGGQIAWLMPAALVLGIAAMFFTRRNAVRAALTLWLGWLLVTALTFSFMAGIFHAYYTVALAPAVAALVGIGAWTLWQRRSSLVATSVLAFTVAFTSVFAWYLLDRADGFVPWLKWLVVVVGLVGALGVALAGHLPRRIALGAAVLALAASLAGPTAYAVSTASTPHTGSIPTAGPSTGSGPGGMGRPGGFGGFGGGPGGTPPGQTQARPRQTQTRPQGQTGGGGAGGLLNGSTSSAALTTLLQTDASSYTWVAAAVGSNNASGYQLASEQPVMAIGGFNGSDPSPTLAQFKAYVANGQIHYFIASGGGMGGGPGRQQLQRDRPVGGGQLHRQDRRRHHRLRPLRRDPVSAVSEVGTSDLGEPLETVVATTVLDVVIPVFNEEAQLAASVERVLEHLATMPWSYRVTIADNASTDQTALIARRLSHTHPEVQVVHLAEKGRGRALKRVWSASDSEVLVYMDVDLSTDLAALLPLVAPLVSGHSDLAIGSRLSRHSRVTRGVKRELISRSYNLILRQTLRARFSDAQCGFKAVRRDAARALLPLVEDNAWFFDTELLVVAERAGLRIHEVPVDWVDDPDSSVDIVRTALDDLKGVARLGRALVKGTLPLHEIGERLGRTSTEAQRGRLGMQVGVFLVIGVGSTLAYALLYLAPQVGHHLALGQLHRPAGHGDREHGGQPPLHLRRARPAGRRTPSAAGARPLRRRARRHHRLPRGAARHRLDEPRPRGHRPDRRQPRRDGAALRRDEALGLRQEGVRRGSPGSEPESSTRSSSRLRPRGSRTHSTTTSSTKDDQPCTSRRTAGVSVRPRAAASSAAGPSKIRSVSAAREAS